MLVLLGVTQRFAGHAIVGDVVRDHEVGVNRPVAVHVRMLGAGVLQHFERRRETAGRGETGADHDGEHRHQHEAGTETSQRCQCGYHQGFSSSDDIIERFASPMSTVVRAG